MFRLILAAIVGWMLGRERKKHNKSGGSRTMAIVCVTSCLIALLTQEIAAMNPEVHNFTRLMAYGISGMGFLGMGVIWKHKGEIEGLTTAATLYLLMPLGYCIGLGFYWYSIVVSVLAYILLESKYIRGFYD